MNHQLVQRSLGGTIQTPHLEVECQHVTTQPALRALGNVSTSNGEMLHQLTTYARISVCPATTAKAS